MANNASRPRQLQSSYTMANNASRPLEPVSIPEMDLENFEAYTVGGYHPIVIGDTFQKGRYTVVHKLGFGGYSTIWLTRDNALDRYVSLKVLVASESSKPKPTEADIIRQLQSVDTSHPGQLFIPKLLDTFSIEGPNGQHTCLVQEAAGCNIATSKEDAGNFMFPAETARSIAAQLIMATEHSPKLHTPPLFLPPEDFFQEPITLAADIWTLGLSLYEVLGERPLFETFACDRDDIIAEMVSTLGPLPTRWWNKWENRKEFFEADGGAWIHDLQRILTPVSRPLHQRMWDMGRGMTPETCEWDVEGGEMQALEDLLRHILAYEPSERPTAEELIISEYMVRWALPAWEQKHGRAKKDGLYIGDIEGSHRVPILEASQITARLYRLVSADWPTGDASKTEPSLLKTDIGTSQSKRRVKPNDNFKGQLQVWAEVEYDIWEDEEHTVPKPAYAVYLQRRAQRLKEAGLTGDEL
ncbi:hypothetical protein DV735_g99, partial [Chaetothyriales sp. CBS 134920]